MTKTIFPRPIMFKYLSFACLCFLLTITTSLTNPDHSSGKVDWLPEDFNPKNVILLVQYHPYGEKQNDRLSEFLEKEYHWRYEIINIDQLGKNKKYDDKKLYQFVLLWKDIKALENTTDLHHAFTYHDIDGHFLDRNTDKEYPQSKLGLGFGQIGYRKVIKAIDKKFKDID